MDKKLADWVARSISILTDCYRYSALNKVKTKKPPGLTRKPNTSTTPVKRGVVTTDANLGCL